MLIINRNKMKRKKKKLISKKIKQTKRDGQSKEQNFEGTFSKGRKKREKKRIARQHKVK